MASRIYYNGRLSSAHGNTTAVSAPLPVRFTDLRPSAVIDKASDYTLSIVRFTTTLEGLPQLIVEHPQIAGERPSATSYSFFLNYGAVTVEAPVLWSPSDDSLRQGSGDLGDPYWYEYSFLRFGSLVNAALSTAMAALIVAAPALTGTPAPFFSFDVASAVWSLYLPKTVTPLTLSANPHAEHLFSGFPVVRQGNVFKYLMFLQPNESPITVGGFQFIVRQQTPGSLTTWSPIRRFVFTSTLPVQPELTVPATPYGDGKTQSANAQIPVITDLTPVLVTGTELSYGTLEYTPTAEFRRIALKSDTAVNDITFSVYWEDDLGGLHQMYLYENGFVSIKLLLEKR